MTIKGHFFTPDMPLLAILNLHVAFVAGHSNIKATAYHAEIITNSFPRHDSYVALCSASALTRRQADSVVALYRLLLPFLSPTKLLSFSLSLSLSLSLCLSRVHRHPLLSSFSSSQIRLVFYLFCYFFFYSSTSDESQSTCQEREPRQGIGRQVTALVKTTTSKNVVRRPL